MKQGLCVGSIIERDGKVEMKGMMTPQMKRLLLDNKKLADRVEFLEFCLENEKRKRHQREDERWAELYKQKAKEHRFSLSNLIADIEEYIGFAAKKTMQFCKANNK